tara:strand:- start:294 stop:518 length:225 start_codon:yes stop_codon:yes gene_type:complete
MVMQKHLFLTQSFRTTKEENMFTKYSITSCAIIVGLVAVLCSPAASIADDERIIYVLSLASLANLYALALLARR